MARARKAAAGREDVTRSSPTHAAGSGAGKGAAYGKGGRPRARVGRCRTAAAGSPEPGRSSAPS